MTRLIIDSGSTKTEWTLIQDGSIVKQGISNGINPNYTGTENTSSNTLDDIVKYIDNKQYIDVYYYGSGCGTKENCEFLNKLLKPIFPNANISIFPDTLAACHALFGEKAGIACILGTGSNASYYDGKSIIKNAVSLGYILGDEGSGNHIGKTLLQDYFYGKMPEDIHQKFEEEFHLDRVSLINHLYHQPSASKYLASFALFADKNQNNSYIENICNQCFNSFIETHIIALDKNNNIEIGFVGSVAYRFRNILEACIESYNLKTGMILEKPMSGLVEYYNLK